MRVRDRIVVSAFLLAIAGFVAPISASEDDRQKNCEAHGYAFFGSKALTVQPDARLDLSREGTIEFWIDPAWAADFQGDAVIVSVSNGPATRYRVYLRKDAAGLSIGLWNGAGTVNEKHPGISVPLAIADDQFFYHVAIVTREAGTEIYLDGGRQRLLSGVGYGSASGLPLHVGSADGKTGMFPGVIAGLRIWNKALPSTALKAHADPGPGPTLERLAAHPELGSLVLYSDFHKGSDTLRFHEIDLTGFWVDRDASIHEQIIGLPADADPTKTFAAVTYRTFVPFPAYQIARVGPQWHLYEDGRFLGALERMSPTNYRLHLYAASASLMGGGAPDVRAAVLRGAGMPLPPNLPTIDFEYRDGSLRCTRLPVAFAGKLQGHTAVLQRQRNFIPQTIKLSDPKDFGYDFDKTTKLYSTNLRAFDITTMDPFNLLINAGTDQGGPSASRGTGRDVYVFDNPTFVKHPDVGKLVPENLQLFWIGEGSSDMERVFTSSAYEYKEAIAARVGFKAKVPVVGAFGASAKYNQELSTMEQKETTTSTRTSKLEMYALVRDQEKTKLHPNFRSRITELARERNFDDFFRTWGTHFPESVTYGGLAIWTAEISKTEFENALSQGISVDVEVGDTSDKGKGGGSAGADLSRSSKFKEIFEHATEKIRVLGGESVPATSEENPQLANHQAPISMELRPLYELLTPQFFDDPVIYLQLRQELETKTNEYVKNQTRYTPRPAPAAPPTLIELDLTSMEIEQENLGGFGGFLEPNVNAYGSVTVEVWTGGTLKPAPLAAPLDTPEMRKILGDPQVYEGGWAMASHTAWSTTKDKPMKLALDNAVSFTDASKRKVFSLTPDQARNFAVKVKLSIDRDDTIVKGFRITGESMVPGAKFVQASLGKGTDGSSFGKRDLTDTSGIAGFFNPGGKGVIGWHSAFVKFKYRKVPDYRSARLKLLDRPELGGGAASPNYSATARYNVIGAEYAPIAGDLRAYYPFNGVLTDAITGRTTPGWSTFQQGASLMAPGRKFRCETFEIPWVPETGGTGFTAHLDFRIDDTSKPCTILTGGDGIIVVGQRNGLLYTDLAGNRKWAGATRIQQGKWHKLVLSVDVRSGIIQVYLDGGRDTVLTPNFIATAGWNYPRGEGPKAVAPEVARAFGARPIIQGPNRNEVIAWEPRQRHFTIGDFAGAVDEFILLGRSMNENEIKWLSARPRLNAHPVAYYSLDGHLYDYVSQRVSGGKVSPQFSDGAMVVEPGKKDNAWLTTGRVDGNQISLHLDFMLSSEKEGVLLLTDMFPVFWAQNRLFLNFGDKIVPITDNSVAPGRWHKLILRVDGEGGGVQAICDGRATSVIDIGERFKRSEGGERRILVGTLPGAYDEIIAYSGYIDDQTVNMLRQRQRAPGIPVPSHQAAPVVRAPLPERDSASSTHRDIVAADSVIAYFPMDDNQEDASGRNAGARIGIREAFVAGAIDLEDDALTTRGFGHSSFRAAVEHLDGISYTVHMDFKVTEWPNLVIAGGGWWLEPWMKVTLDEQGVPMLTLNGADGTKLERQLALAPVSKGEWHKLILSVNLPTREARVQIDGKGVSLEQLAVDVPIPLAMFQQNWLAFNAGPAQLRGAWDELLVFAGKLDDTQLAALAARPRKDPNPDPNRPNLPAVRHWATKPGGVITQGAVVGRFSSFTRYTWWEQPFPDLRALYLPDGKRMLNVNKQVIAIHVKTAEGSSPVRYDHLLDADKAYLRTIKAFELDEILKDIQPLAANVKWVGGPLDGRTYNNVEYIDQIVGRTVTNQSFGSRSETVKLQKGSVYWRPAGNSEYTLSEDADATMRTDTTNFDVYQIDNAVAADGVLYIRYKQTLPQERKISYSIRWLGSQLVPLDQK